MCAGDPTPSLHGNEVDPVDLQKSTQRAALASVRANEVETALQKMLTKDQVTVAEILWTLNCICSHTSQRSASRSFVPNDVSRQRDCVQDAAATN